MSQTFLTTRQIQLVGLNMLKHFDSVCREHNLTYFLSGGTLLGAVRHQGFIPWDDDVDVMMPRPDYNRLLEIASQASTERFVFLSRTEGSYETPYLRVMDTHTVVMQNGYLDQSVPHLFLDIFPIEGLPDNEKACRAFYKKMRAYDIMYQSVRKVKFRENERLQWLKTCVHYFARITGGTSAWCRRFDRAAQKIPFGTTKHSGVCLIAHYGFRECMPAEVFNDTVNVTFEGMEFPAPVGYDRYLSGLYRNYMQLPPEDKRITHKLDCRYADGHPEGTI